MLNSIRFHISFVEARSYSFRLQRQAQATSIRNKKTPPKRGLLGWC